MTMKEIVFIDQNIEVLKAYAKECGKLTNAYIKPGNIFDHGPGVLVIPTNTNGDLDQGLGLQCALRFGENGGVESRLKAFIRIDRGGELGLGEVQIAPTDDADFPMAIFLSIVGRDMLVPGGDVITQAVAEIFRLIDEWNVVNKDYYLIERLLIPGLGTGTLGLTPEESAKAFHRGYHQRYTTTGA